MLLLQGPMGPFFWRLRQDLEQAGAEVKKINFCAADALFYPAGAVSYRDTLEKWPDFFAGFLIEHEIDAVFLFGDCRSYHDAIRNPARALNVPLYVFEEGYLRPDFITIERGGVNNHSSIPRDPEAFTQDEGADEPANSVGSAFSRAALYASLYSVANFLFAWRYPHYRHHRPLHPVHQSYAWVRGWFRKHWFRAKEAKLLPKLTGELSGRYFLAPLQVHNDAQIITHSRFDDVEDFITGVVMSFAEHADPGTAIVFKHHPMDRAYCDYTKLMARLSREYGLEGRLFYVHDLHLPTLLQHARGTVLVNSTVGLQSIHHGTPVKPLGDPIYNLPGLACHDSLAKFWRNPGSIDKALYQRFRRWLLTFNQANGNFYKPLNNVSSHTGIVWPPLGAELIKASERATPVRTRSRAKPESVVVQGEAA